MKLWLVGVSLLELCRTTERLLALGFAGGARKAYRERAALAFDAVRRDASAMPPNDLAYHIQSHAETTDV
jgi:hypothetical protein